ncbi:hypothetical protein KC19_VG321200 [Ceratodon purpureus]|nr:hypothetical protein KC19_VG321200 [Ceratodon purpureus]KAG0575140.1 hypothetical protein KC19_VG321200 [Ceratodon purpureus]
MVYFPVFVEGANLSMDDMHFSEGDREVSYCGAIEMSGFLELKCSIMRGVMEQYFIPMGPGKLNGNPIFEIGPASPSGWCLRASRSAPWSHASPSGCCLPSPL